MGGDVDGVTDMDGAMGDTDMDGNIRDMDADTNWDSINATTCAFAMPPAPSSQPWQSTARCSSCHHVPTVTTTVSQPNVTHHQSGTGRQTQVAQNQVTTTRVSQGHCAKGTPTIAGHRARVSVTHGVT